MDDYEEYLNVHGWKRVGDTHWRKELRTLESLNDASADLYLMDDGWQLVITDAKTWSILYNYKLGKDMLTVLLGYAAGRMAITTEALYKWSKGIQR